MRTDRELLELAAKAAGIQYHAYVENEFFGTGINTGELDVPLWNPLTDDGDALRLAVDLKIIVTFVGGGADEHVCAGKRLGPFSNEPLPIVHFLEQPEIDLKATRRAIVRAAAEIGAASPAPQVQEEGEKQ